MEKPLTSDFDINFKRFFLVLFLLNLTSCTRQYLIYPTENTIIHGQLDWQKKLYFERINIFKKQPIGYNKIIFIGNSITQSGGDWNLRYETNTIINRGISGDYTNGVLKRLDEIIFFKPKAVFLMIGINEFFADNSNNPDISPSYVANNIFKIADTIREKSPNTKIFLHTILPINADQYIKVKKVDYNFLQEGFSPSVNQQIVEANLILKSNLKYSVIDLHSVFVNKNFDLNPNFSTDGVHLNDAGYDFWVKKTRDLLISLDKEI